MSFKPKRIEEPADGIPVPRPSGAQLATALGPLASNLIPTAPAPSVVPRVQEEVPSPQQIRQRTEPALMMSFKASRPFAKMLAEAAEGEGGLRRLIARVFAEAGYPVPQAELNPPKRRRTYD